MKTTLTRTARAAPYYSGEIFVSARGDPQVIN